MAFFINFPSKFERALRSLLINQGKATWEDCFIANDYRDLPLPNRRIAVHQFNPDKPYRPEGVCFCEIQHCFQAVNDQGTPLTTPRIQLDAYIGDTYDTLNLGGAVNATDMAPLADAITLAGRWLAQNNPNGNSAQEQKIVNDNLDMVNFRCDWVKFMSPVQTRGTSREESTVWKEIIHIAAHVSHSNLALPN